ncbi:2-dehydro-3-deoxyphosphooctonate aldolase [Flavobacterium amniphilum]|uniref:2-dehydro-3-deoxyphosphooctonate aldolase n=1 Tax=Flavobacterium amniphilum TaxID=1834035 RepID=UPI00202A88C5|nr:2-dehydro-3-deoxyphosphooctonate aldolase [Flavobacterium amniphilum]MCL9806629.1 2-dehydro-3-deoxyphosphooctonate aldolase [Flavobacterium amniphilum]
MRTKLLFLGSLFLVLTSCISTKLTIRNIDDSVPGPALNGEYNSFIITEKATDKKYAYNENYPVNVGFTSLNDGPNNQIRFLNALAGPNGEKVTYVKKDACCPFPTKKTEMGAGIIDMFEVTWEGNTKPVILYINKFEKGALMIPVGFTARK